ncbi:MAG TPA: pyridoxamine 5'-phosphate oxidase family protein [Acidimicrobiales bacterium]|nr:pyridoxamine 5'-phosphate oxidase family protein [Acidimicrobiales bacterium]
MSRRDQIRMTGQEVDEFLGGRRNMSVATIGHDGRIHMVAMWYGFIDDACAFWTYGKSQKIANLRRNPAITCLVEDGEEYSQLRGVELVGRGVVLEDRESVMAVGASVFERYTGPLDEQSRAALEVVGAKRVAVRIDVERTVSWDHGKLGGRY